MLPSTGLFKALACPFYDVGKCTRPFCHYKHVRKDDVVTETPIIDAVGQPSTIKLLETPAVYKPTPKIFLASTSQLDSSVHISDEPTKKKQRLEYVPTPKTLGRDHHGKNRAPSKSHHKTAEYQPSLTRSNSATTATADKIAQPDVIVLEDCAYETDAIAEKQKSCGEDGTANEHANNPLYVPSRISTDAIEPVAVKEVSNKLAKITDRESARRRDRDKNPSKDKESSDSRGKDKEARVKGNELRGKDTEDRSRTKSECKDKEDRSKDKVDRKKETDAKTAEKDRDRLKEKNSKSSSSSSRHSSKSSSSHRSSDDKRSSSKSSSKTSDRSSKASDRSSKTSDRSSNKKDSSKGSRSDSTASKDAKTKSDLFSLELTMPSPSSVFDSESDEDDVMAQCRQIFDEYKSKPAANTTPTTEKTSKISEDDQSKYDDAHRKKRVAYDGAEHTRPAQNPNAKLGKNYSHIAMESVFKRQEIVRIQLEKMEEKKATEAAANAKRLADLEADRVAKARQVVSRHRVGDPNTSIRQPVLPPPLPMRVGTIKPASNILAMQRAKEKIDQLRAAKMPTIARTAAKTTGRVAHMTSVTADELKPSPPVLEPQSTKISFNIRMQYYNLMVKHCNTIYDDCNDAWERAQSVEMSVFKKCNTPVIYKKSATMAINTLRKEAIEAGNVSTETSKTISHDVILAGKQGQNTSWSVNKSLKSSGPTKNPLDTVSSTKAFDMIYDLRLTDEQLHDNGYPRPGDRPGWAKVHQTRTTAQPNNENDRYCRRCGKIFNISHYDEAAVDQCNYHNKSPGYRRGHTDHFHRCCQQPAGTPGCMYANYHVAENSNAGRLSGFVKTIARPDEYRTSRADVFALDCEMCYTTCGLELTRVTVVDFNQKTIYDALVKPDNKVVDYNTIYSGITEQMLEKETRTLRDVQAVLLSMFHAKTILIGHSLDSDMKALKLLHDVVVDTAVLYPHKMGLPMKRALKTLCIENLKRIIQESEAGHDSAEDAEVCIQLVRHYLQNKIL